MKRVISIRAFLNGLPISSLVCSPLSIRLWSLGSHSFLQIRYSPQFIWDVACIMETTTSSTYADTFCTLWIKESSWEILELFYLTIHFQSLKLQAFVYCSMEYINLTSCSAILLRLDSYVNSGSFSINDKFLVVSYESLQRWINPFCWKMWKNYVHFRVLHI